MTMVDVFRIRTRLLRFLCIAGIGISLAGCSTPQSQLLQREQTACKLIGTPPKLPTPNAAKFVAISVKASLVSSLEKSKNVALETVAHELNSAALEESQTGNGIGMVRALDNGVAVCHRLGLST
jgi:pectin methylesterase-like acyl-CoA thioesterase